MKKQIDDVGAFHAKFGLDHLEATVPSSIYNDNLLMMRFNFMLEELTEWGQANGLVLSLTKGEVKFETNEWSEPDRSASLDGAVDLVYVLVGTLRLFGYHAFNPTVSKSVFDEAWQRVQNANMAKVRCTDASTSKRKSEFDIIKPDGWQPPFLDDLVG